MKTARDEMAASGVLRAAINTGNPVLAKPGVDGGDPTGVSVDLARELARRLDLPVTFIAFDTASRVFEALDNGAWEVAFLANEPERATKIAFTTPYVIIEGTYLVRADSPYQSVAELDQPGLRVASCRAAAYDLFLSRNLKHAERVLSDLPAASMAAFLAQGLDAAAGVRQALQAFAADKPGLRVVEDRFMAIGQAVAAPQGRPAAAAYLEAFVAEAKRSGFIRAALDRHGHADLAVAP
ncbi:MAG: transporter substrate-binding domain-containing protein [Elsteraceae bacterium]